MSIFEAQEFDDHEKVLFVNEPSVGLRGIIAIHNTTLGPALGGCRMWPYETEAAAIRDVLRLSRGMSHKAAVLDCGLGGGKSVIIGEAGTQKTPALLQSMGRFIDSLNEQYITGEDIGTNPDDMREIRKSTHCVSCLHKEDGGLGDPAPLTALGVYGAIRAGLINVTGSADLDGVVVAVQGVGNVGTNLCQLLHDAGAKLVVSDVDPARADNIVSTFGATAVAADDIYTSDATVYSPCAMGSTLNDDTIPLLKARVVAGAANNQLDAPRHGEMLAERGIAYMPDFVANGGGLVSCAAEWYRNGENEVRRNVENIHDTCLTIIARAEETGKTTAEAAVSIAEERIARGRKDD